MSSFKNLALLKAHSSKGLFFFLATEVPSNRSTIFEKTVSFKAILSFIRILLLFSRGRHKSFHNKRANYVMG